MRARCTRVTLFVLCSFVSCSVALALHRVAGLYMCFVGFLIGSLPIVARYHSLCAPMFGSVSFYLLCAVCRMVLAHIVAFVLHVKVDMHSCCVLFCITCLVGCITGFFVVFWVVFSVCCSCVAFRASTIVFGDLYTCSCAHCCFYLLLFACPVCCEQLFIALHLCFMKRFVTLHHRFITFILPFIYLCHLWCDIVCNLVGVAM